MGCDERQGGKHLDVVVQIQGAHCYHQCVPPLLLLPAAATEWQLPMARESSSPARNESWDSFGLGRSTCWILRRPGKGRTHLSAAFKGALEMRQLSHAASNVAP